MRCMADVVELHDMATGAIYWTDVEHPETNDHEQASFELFQLSLGHSSFAVCSFASSCI